jgi:hypothetical protein
MWLRLVCATAFHFAIAGGDDQHNCGEETAKPSAVDRRLCLVAPIRATLSNDSGGRAIEQGGLNHQLDGGKHKPGRLPHHRGFTPQSPIQWFRRD